MSGPPQYQVCPRCRYRQTLWVWHGQVRCAYYYRPLDFCLPCANQTGRCIGMVQYLEDGTQFRRQRLELPPILSEPGDAADYFNRLRAQQAFK